VKISFEGNTIRDIIVRVRDMLEELSALEKIPAKSTTNLNSSVAAPAAEVQGPGPERGPDPVPKATVLVDKAGEISGDKPGKKPRTAKQLENDERLRVAAVAKLEAKRAAKQGGTPVDPKAAAPKPVKASPPPPQPQGDAMFQEPVDPAEVVKIRQKTIEDLQSAYANGHQAEVFELLARFGNGAKSFRELPPEAFMPIREAIDKGALT
jgi:hypothetical protein